MVVGSGGGWSQVVGSTGVRWLGVVTGGDRWCQVVVVSVGVV